MSIPAVNLKLTPKQTRAFNALMNGEAEDVLYGGAKGGGKSVLGCIFAYTYAHKVATHFNLKPSKKAPHIGIMCRKIASNLTGTTLQTWQEIIPESHYELKSGTDRYPTHISLFGGSICIDYCGLDNRESISKFNSAEYGFIFVDQAEETSRDDVAVLRASLRMKIDRKPLPLPYVSLWTANPADCWLLDEFILKPEPNTMFIPALPSDNPHLPDSYIATLKKSFRHRPDLLRAYLDGIWDNLSVNNQVVLRQWMNDAAEKSHFRKKRRVVSCDLARYGDDETTFYALDDTDIVGSHFEAKTSTTHAAAALFTFAREHKAELIVIDGGGIGGPLVDIMRDMGHFDILSVDSGGKRVLGDMKYNNMRTEMYFSAGDMFADGKVRLTWQDDELKTQLMEHQYRVEGTQMRLEPKEETKKRLNGRSPDRADGYVMGLLGTKLLWEDITVGDGKGMLLYQARDKMTKTTLNLHSSEYFDEQERRIKESVLEKQW